MVREEKNNLIKKSFIENCSIKNKKGVVFSVKSKISSLK